MPIVSLVTHPQLILISLLETVKAQLGGDQIAREYKGKGCGGDFNKKIKVSKAIKFIILDSDIKLSNDIYSDIH